MTIHAAMVPQEKTQQHVRVLGMPSRALTPHAKNRALALHAKSRALTPHAKNRALALHAKSR